MSFKCNKHGWHHIYIHCPSCSPPTTASNSSSTPIPFSPVPTLSRELDEWKSVVEPLKDEVKYLSKELALANEKLSIAVEALESLALNPVWTTSIVDESVTNEFDEMFELKRERKTRPIKTSMTEAKACLKKISEIGVKNE